MNRLTFLIHRTLRHEAPLAALSIPQQTLLDACANQTIALVGNARSLAQSSFGPQIDAADLIIRINRAPMPSPRSHGTRTDWLALATSLPADTPLHPSRYLWMSPKRKRLSHAIATSPGFYLHPLPDIAALHQTLHAPPTTGLMLIDLLRHSHAAAIQLYGFDFFATQSLSGRRTAAQTPHNFPTEQAFTQSLLARDPRFTLRQP
ncbi:MAG: glycosyltransferase family 29 protein [Paracoccaceae bacterium]